MCDKAHYDALNERVDAVEGRLAKVEENMASGFNTVTRAVNQLAADFGSRMNTLDHRIVEEKAEWGRAFRRWLDWTFKVVLAGCLAAMGLTAAKMFFCN